MRNVEECQKNCSVIQSIPLYRNFKIFLEVVMEVYEYVLNRSQIMNTCGNVLKCRTEEKRRQEWGMFNLIWKIIKEQQCKSSVLYLYCF
jgi:hypothetical protein